MIAEKNTWSKGVHTKLVNRPQMKPTQLTVCGRRPRNKYSHTFRCIPEESYTHKKKYWSPTCGIDWDSLRELFLANTPNSTNRCYHSLWYGSSCPQDAYVRSMYVLVHMIPTKFAANRCRVWPSSVAHGCRQEHFSWNSCSYSSSDQSCWRAFYI